MDLLLGAFEDLCGRLADGGVDLLVADPPYHRVKEEDWDREHRDLDGWLSWAMDCWGRRAAPLLRLGGTLLVFGYFRPLALLTPLLEAEGLACRGLVVLRKGARAVAGRHDPARHLFPPKETELLAVFVRDPLPEVRRRLREAASGLSAAEVNRRLGGATAGGGMWNFYAGNNAKARIPTREAWGRLRAALPSLAGEWEDFAPVFNSEERLTDVWDYSPPRDRVHPCEKDGAVLRRAVRVWSRPGDLVVDPFAGSFSLARACRAEGRLYWGTEKDGTWWEAGVRATLQQS